MLLSVFYVGAVDGGYINNTSAELWLKLWVYRRPSGTVLSCYSVLLRSIQSLIHILVLHVQLQCEVQRSVS